MELICLTKICYFGEGLVMSVWFEGVIIPHDIYNLISLLTANQKQTFTVAIF